jgi:hypothetical protein
MSIQAQWSLDQTVGSALAVARGIFQAATNDNVQPLAILACEISAIRLRCVKKHAGKLKHL